MIFYFIIESRNLTDFFHRLLSSPSSKRALCPAPPPAFPKAFPKTNPSALINIVCCTGFFSIINSLSYSFVNNPIFITFLILSCFSWKGKSTFYFTVPTATIQKDRRNYSLRRENNFYRKVFFPTPFF